MDEQKPLDQLFKAEIVQCGKQQHSRNESWLVHNQLRRVFDFSQPLQLQNPSAPSLYSTATTMASIYTCSECNTNLNLNTSYTYPPDFYFEAGNKNSISFSTIDATKFKFEKEDKIRPFFETINYWGIQRKRTKIKCNNCNHLVGYVYDDGPPLINTPGQFHMGPSQVIPRAPRYRFKSKSLRITSQT